MPSPESGSWMGSTSPEASSRAPELLIPPTPSVVLDPASTRSKKPDPREPAVASHLTRSVTSSVSGQSSRATEVDVTETTNRCPTRSLEPAPTRSLEPAPTKSFEPTPKRLLGPSPGLREEWATGRRLPLDQVSEPASTVFINGIEMAGPIELAVIWAHKAKSGSEKWVDSCSKSQIHHYYVRKTLEPVTCVINALYLSMAFFEEPTWCVHEHCDTFFRANSTDPRWSHWEIPTVRHQWTSMVEICFLFYFTFYYWLRRKSLGAAHYLSFWHCIGGVSLIFCWCDCVVAITLNQVGFVPGSFRISRLIRPFVFLSASYEMRTTLNQVLRSIPRVSIVLLSLVLCLLMFVWFGIVLFCNTAEHSKFFSWSAGVASLWVTFTTANFPDVMIPGYRENRLNFIFFSLYLVFSFFIMSNVLLAAVYDSFKTELGAGVVAYYTHRRAAIAHAFDLLANDSGRVPMRTWLVFLKTYCSNQRKVSSHREAANDKINARRSLHVFQALGLDDTSGLSREDFSLVMELLCDVSFRTLQFPSRNSLRHIPGGLKWDNFVDCAIFVNLLVVFIQTTTFVSAGGGGPFDERTMLPQNVWYWVPFSFTCLFALDVSFDIFRQGPLTYWNSKPFQNRYDALNVYGLLLASVWLLLSPSTPLMKVILVLQMCRLERLLVHIKSVQQLGILLTRLTPTYRQLGLLLVIVFYTFATLGVQLFGGKIYPGNPALSHTDFDASDYYDFNFNDFASACVTLFCLMVVNNWSILADGFMKVTGDWAGLFFVGFFIVTNLVSLNILMALIIDCSATLKNDVDSLADLHDHTASCVQGSVEPAVQVHQFSRRMVLHRILMDDCANDTSFPERGISYKELLGNVQGPLLASGTTTWLDQYSMFRSQISTDDSQVGRLSCPPGQPNNSIRFSNASRSRIMSAT